MCGISIEIKMFSTLKRIHGGKFSSMYSHGIKLMPLHVKAGMPSRQQRRRRTIASGCDISRHLGESYTSAPGNWN